MKKILLLFVLFLGVNVGAFAAGEVEPSLKVVIIEIKKDEPTKAFIYWMDGTTTTVDDGTVRWSMESLVII